MPRNSTSWSGLVHFVAMVLCSSPLAGETTAHGMCVCVLEPDRAWNALTLPADGWRDLARESRLIFLWGGATSFERNPPRQNNGDAWNRVPWSCTNAPDESSGAIDVEAGRNRGGSVPYQYFNHGDQFKGRVQRKHCGSGHTTFVCASPLTCHYDVRSKPRCFSTTLFVKQKGLGSFLVAQKVASLHSKPCGGTKSPL